MSDPAPDPEPLAFTAWRAPGGGPARGVRAERFELSSRGDRVPGLLWLPEEAGSPAPLVLLAHGAGGSKEAAYLTALGAPWAQRGAAVACIDLPLHGERASAKLTDWLLEGLAPGSPDEGTRLALWRGVVRQAVHDLRRTLDALAKHPDVDASRTAFAGLSLGALLGAHFCAADPRPRAAALALAGGGFGPPDLDPAAAVARIAPRPVLLVNAERDARIPREAALRLAEAAGPGARQLWFDAPHHELPGRALKAMWSFLEGRLAD